MDYINLSDMREDDLGKISGYLGGSQFIKKLTGMGLHRGANLRVIKRGCPGPWLIEVEDDFKVAVGCNMASMIIVKKSMMKNNPME